MQFAHPQAFIYATVILLIIFLLFYTKKWLQKTLKLFGNTNTVTQWLGQTKFNAKWVIFSMAIFCLVVALMGPQLNNGKQKVEGSNNTTIFCLDLSNSMNAKDASPTRLERSKLFLKNIVNTLDNQNVGLVVFAGKALIATPATMDKEALIMQASAMQTNTIPYQGTNISSALKAALNSFDNKLAGKKSIVLISDGENHEEALDAVLEILEEQKIQLATVAVGTNEGALVTDENTAPVMDDDGKQVLSKSNITLLEEIATKANGLFISINSLTNAENSLIKFLNTNLSTSGNFTNIQNYKQYYQWLLLPAILLLIIYFLKTKKALNFLNLLVLIFFMGSNAKAQQFDKVLNNGNNLYKEKKYDTAARAYNAITKNIGFADKDRAIAFYNLGNAYAKQEDWQAAINNYEQSLLLDPTSQDAKYNLIYAQRKLDKNKKDNNGNDPKDKKEDKQQKEQQQQQQQKQKQKEPQQNTNNQSKLTPQQAKQLLNALKQQEQKLMQDKLKGKQQDVNSDRKNW